MSNQRFAEKMFQLATDAAQRWPINPAIVAAQACLESGYGRSILSTKANNLYGIKVGRSWKGPKYPIKTREWSPDQGTYVIVAEFRLYGSWLECIEDLGKIISSLSWYKDAASNAHDPVKYLEGILPTAREPGWATDPHYRAKILTIARRHGWIQ